MIRIGATQSMDSMNPFLAVRLVSTAIHRWMYGYLTVTDSKTLQPSPDLAESWTTSPDGLTWTFKIREAKWSDGQPITAEDAAWTFNKMMTDDGAKTANGPAVENFASVTASGQDLTIKLKTPQASMLENPVPIMPKHVWEKVTDIGKFEAETYPAVTSGPYIAVEHKKDQYVKLEANPNYWRGGPKIDELQVDVLRQPGGRDRRAEEGRHRPDRPTGPAGLRGAQGRRQHRAVEQPGPALVVPADQPRRDDHATTSRSATATRR